MNTICSRVFVPLNR